MLSPRALVGGNPAGAKFAAENSIIDFDAYVYHWCASQVRYDFLYFSVEDEAYTLTFLLICSKHVLVNSIVAESSTVCNLGINLTLTLVFACLGKPLTSIPTSVVVPPMSATTAFWMPARWHNAHYRILVTAQKPDHTIRCSTAVKRISIRNTCTWSRGSALGRGQARFAI